METILKSFVAIPAVANMCKRDCVLFTCTQDGLVDWIFHEKDHVHQHIVRKIKGRNIRDFYKLDRGKSLLEMADQRDLEPGELAMGVSLGGYTYDSKNLIENMYEGSDFHSNLVYSILYLKALKKEKKILGQIMQRQQVPFYFLEQMLENPIVVIDEEGRMCGLNGSFVKNFRSLVYDPASALGKNAVEFLSANPLALFERKILGLEAVQSLDWEEALRLPFTGKVQADQFEVTLPRTASQEKGEGLRWKCPPGAEENFLTLLSNIDLESYDIRVTFRARLLKGSYPNCIIGGDRFDQTRLFPDYRGYNIGFMAGVPKIVFKKRGYTLHQVPVAPDLPDECSFEVIKYGAQLYFSCEKCMSEAVFDGSPLVNMGKHVSLFLRPGSEVLLREIRVRLRKAIFAPREGAELSLLNDTDNAFRVHQLATQLQAPGGRLLYVYYLEDISTLKHRIVKLEKENIQERAEKERLRSMLREREEQHAYFIGESKAISDIKQKAAVVAETRSTILVEGETGTGKEVLAHYIHSHGIFRGGPFIKVDCASLPEGLIESELFGHKKGAFTGALSDKKGKFELAEKGTLFLDEIANINLDVQAKLLGFLQDFTVQPVGGTRSVRLDLRVVCATNRNLAALVEKGLFREDLFYRLNVVKFTLPPLCERSDDIPAFALFFLREFSRELGVQARSFSPAAFRKLCACPWPGNVRELKSVVQKAVMFSKDPVINEEAIEIEAAAAPRRKTVGEPAGGRNLVNIRKVTREEMVRFLAENNGTVYATAKKLGVNRKTLYNKIERFKINLEELRPKGK